MTGMRSRRPPIAARLVASANPTTAQDQPDHRRLLPTTRRQRPDVLLLEAACPGGASDPLGAGGRAVPFWAAGHGGHPLRAGFDRQSRHGHLPGTGTCQRLRGTAPGRNRVPGCSASRSRRSAHSAAPAKEPPDVSPTSRRGARLSLHPAHRHAQGLRWRFMITSA